MRCFQRSRSSERKAFTLIELLVVTAILGLVVTAIGACLAGGIRIWDAAQHFGEGESQAYLGLHTFSRDLRNAFPCNCGKRFDGGPTSVSFPAFVARKLDADPDQVGRVEYAFEAHNKLLVKLVYDETDTLVLEEPVVKGVERLMFSYRERSGENGRTLTESEVCTNFPAAVDVHLEILNDGETLDLHHTVALRISGNAP